MVDQRVPHKTYRQLTHVVNKITGDRYIISTKVRARPFMVDNHTYKTYLETAVFKGNRVTLRPVVSFELIQSKSLDVLSLKELHQTIIKIISNEDFDKIKNKEENYLTIDGYGFSHSVTQNIFQLFAMSRLIFILVWAKQS